MHARALVDPGGTAGIGCIDAQAALEDAALVELSKGPMEQGQGGAAFAPSCQP